MSNSALRSRMDFSPKMTLQCCTTMLAIFSIHGTRSPESPSPWTSGIAFRSGYPAYKLCCGYTSCTLSMGRIG